MIERLFRFPTERKVFSNGLTLVHRPNFASEVFSIQVWVKTGSIHEGPLLGSGVSHFLEHMLFKGTERRDGKAIGREVHAMGGSINAYTTFDRTVYHLDGPSESFSQAADLLADLIFQSRISGDEVERERDVILREIDMGLDDPDRRLTQALFRTAFQRHPYGQPVIGHRELFNELQREDLLNYHKERYIPNNIVVSVVGAVSREPCAEVIENTFGGYPRGRLAPVPVEEEPTQLAARREHAEGDFQVFRGGMAFKVPHLSHPDSPCLDTLAHALGGGESSLLWERLRNRRQLVHYVDCRNWNPGGRGLFWIGYVCDHENADTVERAIHECLQEVEDEGFDEAVVEKARRQALSSEISGRQTMSGQATRIGLGEVVLGDVHYARRYLKRLQGVQSGDLRTAARRYLVEDGLSVATLGAKPGAAKKDGTGPGTRPPPPFETVVMPGGARVLLQEDRRLPKLHMRCVFRGGPVYEPPGRRGVSALLAELLTKDTDRRSAEEISKRIEGLGGSFTGLSGNNTISLGLEVLPVDWEAAVELLEDALVRPAFEPATFQNELRAQIAEIKEEEDEVLEYGFRELRKRFFGEHPFAVAPAGRVEDLERLSRDDLVGHYERLITAPNLVLAVSGDFDREKLLERLRPLFVERMAAHSFEPVVPGACAGPEGPVEEVIEVDREQAVVLEAFPDAGLRDEEKSAVSEMLQELFNGMSSRLFERVRDEKGMAYYVGSTRVPGLESGMFAFYAGTHPDLIEDVSAEIDLEIDRVATGAVREEELERCRKRLKAGRTMGRQTFGARAMRAALQTSYGLSPEDDAAYARQLGAIDAGVLAGFVREYFKSSRKVRLVVRPKSGDAGGK